MATRSTKTREATTKSTAARTCPRIRPGIAAARADDDPHAIILYDEMRVSRRQVRVSPREFTWLQWFDGTQSLRDIAGLANHSTDGTDPQTALGDLAARLDEALFLDGPRFQQLLFGPVREPSCIGCYPAEPDAIRAQLFNTYTMPGGPGAAKAKRPGKAHPLLAVLAPHIDYARGNIAYAWAYRDLPALTDASLFVIVGTSHYSSERFSLTRQHFRTPLGQMTVDQNAVDRIAEFYGDGLFDDPLAHLSEHSIELEVVWLQYLFEGRTDIRIVPLLVGSFRDCIEYGQDPMAMPDIARMVEALRHLEKEAGEPICYVISGDLAHIGPKFGDADRLTAAALAQSQEADEAILAANERADPAGYFQAVAAERDQRRICGLPPTWTVLQAARPTTGRRLHYAQYAHPQNVESVSFASMAFYA